MNINNPTTFATPAPTWSTSNSSGTSGAMRADDTLAIFTTTVPTILGYADTAATGDNAYGSREDHVHGCSIEFAVLKKSADEGVTSSTTFQNDNHFTLAVTANEVWLIEYRLKLSGVTTGGIKWQFSLPSGASVSWYYQCWTGTDTVASKFGGNPMTTGDANISTGSAAVNVIEAIITARVTVDSTAGNVIPQWAQEVSDSTATVIEAESYQIAILE